jgi:hypothetical protein
MTDAETRAERVGEWRASGLSAVKFAEGRDFTASKLWNWSAKIRKGAQEGGPPGLEHARAGRLRLARVVRVPSPAPDARPVGVELSVELWGVRVGVPVGFDRATLTAVLDEVEARAGKRAAKR